MEQPKVTIDPNPKQDFQLIDPATGQVIGKGGSVAEAYQESKS